MLSLRPLTRVVVEQQMEPTKYHHRLSIQLLLLVLEEEALNLAVKEEVNEDQSPKCEVSLVRQELDFSPDLWEVHPLI